MHLYKQLETITRVYHVAMEFVAMEFVLLGSEVGGISGMDARLRFDLQKRRGKRSHNILMMN